MKTKLVLFLIISSALILTGLQKPRDNMRSLASVDTETATETPKTATETLAKEKELDKREKDLEAREKKLERENEKKDHTYKEYKNRNRKSTFSDWQTQEESHVDQLFQMNSMIQYTTQMLGENQRLIQGMNENMSYLTGPAMDLTKNNQQLFGSLELLFQNRTPYTFPELRYQTLPYSNGNMEFSSRDRNPVGFAAPMDSFPQGFDMRNNNGSAGMWL